MRRLIFALLTAAGLGLWFFVTPAGLYLSAALLAAAMVSAAENLADKPEVRVSYDELFPKKGHAPVLTFGGSKTLRGRVLCENLLTGERCAIDTEIKKDRTLALPAQKDCGRLLIRFVQFSRYDILGLTRRTAVCYAEDVITVMPDKAEVTAVLDRAAGEEELEGAREYTEGEQLRHINFKLTHRFGRLYLNTYAPEKSGAVVLFGDYGLGEDTAAAAEFLCSLAEGLSAAGIAFGLALPEGGDRVKLTKNISPEDAVIQILHTEMYKGESLLAELLRQAGDGVQIFAATKNRTLSDDRVTYIDF